MYFGDTRINFQSLFKTFEYLIFFLVYISHVLLVPPKKKKKKIAISEISTISLISRNISGYGGRVFLSLLFRTSAFIARYNSSFAGYSNATFVSTSTTRCNNGEPRSFPPPCSFSRFRISRDGSNARLNASVSDILSFWIIVPRRKNEILIARFVSVEISFPPRGKVIIRRKSVRILNRVYKILLIP